MIELAVLLFAASVQDACSFPETKVLARELTDGLRAIEEGQHGRAVAHLVAAVLRPLPREQLVCAYFSLAVASLGLEAEARKEGRIESAVKLHERAADSACSALELDPQAQPQEAIQQLVDSTRFGCRPKQPGIRPGMRLGIGLSRVNRADESPAVAYGVAAGTGAVDGQRGVGFVGAIGFGYRPFWKSRRWHCVLGVTVLGGKRWTTGRSDTESSFFTLGVDLSIPSASRQRE
jgi:hypothetical protein